MQREHSQPKVGCVNCSKSKGKVKWNDGVCKAWAAQESSKQEENPTAIQGLATQNKSLPGAQNLANQGGLTVDPWPSCE